MPFAGIGPRAEYAEAVEELATRVLRALKGTKDTGMLADHLRNAADIKAALAAVRVLGADVLAPYALRDVPLTAEEAEAVAEAHRVFPLAAADSRTAAITAWRDWGTARVLASCGWDVLDAPQPDGAAEPDPGSDWQRWSVRMAQLSPLALPVLDGPVHDAARRHCLSLSRGAVRSMLRRDSGTGAGLARWLALVVRPGRAEAPQDPAMPDPAQPDPAQLDPVPLLEHLRLFGAADARTALDVTIAQHVAMMRRASG
jgi:hypothetical protein